MSVELFMLLRLPLPFRAHSLTLVPQFARPALKICPFAIKKAILLPALLSIFKEALADGDFDFLTNKWLSITVTDLDFEFLISFSGETLELSAPDTQISHDVSFKASAEDLLLIAGRKQDPDTLFFQRRLLIEGDTELGLEVKNLIDSVDLDSLPSFVHRLVQGTATYIDETRMQHVKANAL